MTTELKPIDPQEAKEWCLENRLGELAAAAYKVHDYRLYPFVEWCSADDEVINLNVLSGRDFHQYKKWRREIRDCNKVTMATRLGSI